MIDKAFTLLHLISNIRYIYFYDCGLYSGNVIKRIVSHVKIEYFPSRCTLTVDNGHYR